MSVRSKIEWCDATWNPVRGCTAVSPGCLNCYAARDALRHAGAGGSYEGLATKTASGLPIWTGAVDLAAHRLRDPVGWKQPKRIFVNSMSDLFHEDVPDAYIDSVFAVMNATAWRLPLPAEDPARAERWHTYQVLTKRPRRMRDYMQSRAGTFPRGSHPVLERRGTLFWSAGRDLLNAAAVLHWPPGNVELGVSVETQETLDARVPLLLDTPAAFRFVSAEPLLEALDFRGRRREERALCIRCGQGPEAAHDHPDGYRTHGLDLIIVGGESGPLARPCDTAWVRAIVRQCDESGVACFVKQLGANVEATDAIDPIDQFPNDAIPRFSQGSGYSTARIHLKNAKGGDPAEWPADLRVRQLPGAIE